MNRMHWMISKRMAMVLLNLFTLLVLWADDHLKPTFASIAGDIIALLIGNVLAWRSGRAFPDWK